MGKSVVIAAGVLYNTESVLLLRLRSWHSHFDFKFRFHVKKGVLCFVTYSSSPNLDFKRPTVIPVKQPF